MTRTFVKYSAVLIGLYIVVFNGTKAGAVMKEGAKGAVSIIKSFQGR